MMISGVPMADVELSLAISNEVKVQNVLSLYKLHSRNKTFNHRGFKVCEIFTEQTSELQDGPGLPPLLMF